MIESEIEIVEIVETVETKTKREKKELEKVNLDEHLEEKKDLKKSEDLEDDKLDDSFNEEMLLEKKKKYYKVRFLCTKKSKLSLCHSLRFALTSLVSFPNKDMSFIHILTRSIVPLSQYLTKYNSTIKYFSLVSSLLSQIEYLFQNHEKKMWYGFAWDKLFVVHHKYLVYLSGDLMDIRDYHFVNTDTNTNTDVGAGISPFHFITQPHLGSLLVPCTSIYNSLGMILLFMLLQPHNKQNIYEMQQDKQQCFANLEKTNIYHTKLYWFIYNCLQQTTPHAPHPALLYF